MIDVGRTPVLKFDNVHLSFGGVQALSGVSFDLKEGEILAIIGPNGAGKTCLLNCISGFYRPQQGDIYFEGRRITHLPPHKIPMIGIGRTFQNIELFTTLTILENLLAARHVFLNSGFLKQGLYFGWAQREEAKHREAVEEIIDFLEMQAIRNKKVEVLPYGLRKKVELGRTLAMEPKLLLLDEIVAGMNLEEKEDIVRLILDIHEGRGDPSYKWFLSRAVHTIILIEHDMGVVMDIADRIIVLDFGRKIAEGTPVEIVSNPEVIKAYLGEEEL